MYEFVIDSRLAGFTLATVEGRAGALRAAAPIVAEIRDPSLRPGYVRVLARRLGLDMGEVRAAVEGAARAGSGKPGDQRSEEHTSELQSLMRISSAGFGLKKKQKKNTD